MKLTVLSEGGQETLTLLPGESVLEALNRAEKKIDAPCGGNGTCGKCRVEISGPDGWEKARACVLRPETDLTVRLPEARRVLVNTDFSEAAETPAGTEEGLGIACDIGTTTVVCRLVRLSDGAALGVVGEANAQRSFGADVISRIGAASSGQLSALTGAIVGQLSDMILRLCREAETDPALIRRMAVAGNTVMLHLLCGLSPEGIGTAPFLPLSFFGERIPAETLGLPPLGCDVLLFPCVSGYVGGDITADLLALEGAFSDPAFLLIDVGTNGEMVLCQGDRMLCCATAAGPAFEGAEISCGMQAAPGAIGSVTLVGGDILCGTVGDADPVGLCGSGLIDAVAVLLRLGILDETGRMLRREEAEDEDAPALSDALKERLFDVEDRPAFRLAGEVYLSQADVRSLQLGKAAIAAGAAILRKKMGQPKISALLLAGGFGSSFRPESAAAIGLIPKDLLAVTRCVGNAAAEGARRALLLPDAESRLGRLRDRMAYLELSGLPDFSDTYIDAMLFE